MSRLLCAAGVLACAFAGTAGSAVAQRMRPGGSVAQPVVQPLPSQQNLKLNAALSRLGRNPRDLEALIDAGNVALAMGDTDAAIGFFRRADQVSSRDPRVKAGLGGAMVRNGDPLAAISLFDEAERAGAQTSALVGDRGLAYDLVGDNATAQRLYRLALARGPSEEITRRLALSLAISGDGRGADATLMPLLRQQDKAAWRTRTFALAILGQPDESVRIAKTILPEKLAESMAPYLRYMSELTPAQQAAAANLGNFPRASEIGRDDPRFAQYAARSARSPSVAAADAGLVPKGEPLGRNSRSRGERQSSQKARQERSRQERNDRKPSRTSARSSSRSSSSDAVRIAPPEPQPGRQPVESGTAPAAARPAPSTPSMSAPAVASASPTIPQISSFASPAAAASAPQPAAPAPAPSAQIAVAPPPEKPAAPVPQPGFDLAKLPQSQPASPPPAAASPQRPAAPQPSSPQPAPDRARLDQPAIRLSLAEAFRDFEAPSTSAAPAAGAVDISSITPAKPKLQVKLEPAKAALPKPAPPKPAPPKLAPPSHPSRIWVQLGVGRDKAALGIDWRRLSRQATNALKGRKAYISGMGQSNRMLVGPFDSAAQANKFIAELRTAGVDGPYIWTSPAGQVVDALPNR